MAQLAEQVMQEAKGRAKKASVLVARLEPVLRRRYDEDSVSAWVTGRTVPPADALLAAAKVSGISIDEYLQSEEALERTADRIARQTQEIEELSEKVQRLTEVVAAMPELQEIVRTQGEAIKVLRRQLSAKEQQLGGT
jgi:transcriptional regulator with XRE-family HTH domain